MGGYFKLCSVLFNSMNSTSFFPASPSSAWQLGIGKFGL
ncbi:unnamed protein product, partial [Vitis vinifera]